jgi:fluoroquinolone resistance protein
LAFHFEHCQLRLASFYKVKMKGTKFIACNLDEVDFTETDLTNASFDECDLNRAIFDRTKLQKADFRTAFNYALDPEENQIKKAKFSANGIADLLAKYDIIIE